MPVEYKNRIGKNYFLHVSKTKKGKPKYYFSMKRDGQLLDETPEGYEIYEHPINGQVFLRRKVPQVITEIEKRIIEKEMKKSGGSRRHVLDIRGKVITIFESNQDFDELKEFLSSNFGPGPLPSGLTISSAIDDIINTATQYSPMMRFTLVDEKRRTFIVERYCYLGSIYDWIQTNLFSDKPASKRDKGNAQQKLKMRKIPEITIHGSIDYN